MHPGLPWYGWALLVIGNLGFVLGAALLRRKRAILPADRIAGLATVLGVDTFAFLRALLFDSSACGQSPSLACIFNQNRGVLALGALLVAAATVYVNARLKQMEDWRSQARRKREAFRMLSEAIDELVHNLQHFAHQVNDELQFLSFPATTFEATTALSHTGILCYLHPNLTRRLNTLQRILAHNRATLVSAAELDRSLRVFSLLDQTGIVALPAQRVLQELQNQGGAPNSAGPALLQPKAVTKMERPPLANLLTFDDRIITHSVRFILEAAYFHGRDCARLLMAPQFRWLDDFIIEMKRVGTYGYWHKSSEVQDGDAAELRAAGSRLYCWIVDRSIDGVETIGIRTTLRDLAHMPH